MQYNSNDKIYCGVIFIRINDGDGN